MTQPLLPDGPLPSLHAKCMRCGRPLSNPVSRAIGYGSLCASLAGVASPQGGLFDRIEVGPKSWPAEMLRLPRQPKDCTYSGVHVGSDAVVTVCSGGSCGPLAHLVYHSPTGFSWGYGGSGPADLARSILADFAGRPVADAAYQDFKFDVIARLPETWRLDGVSIFRWLDGWLRRRAA